MSKQQLVIEARRERYDMNVSTMTVGELINFLMDFDEDAEIVLSHDNGYTYGGICEQDFSEVFDVEINECQQC